MYPPRPWRPTGRWLVAEKRIFVCLCVCVGCCREFEKLGGFRVGVKGVQFMESPTPLLSRYILYYMYIYLYNMPGLDSERVPLSVNRLLE